MRLTYAVADLHGDYDLFKLALIAIDRHGRAAQPGQRTVVFLGDYIDRGPQGPEIIAALISGPPEGWAWICLKGNHEDMMASAVGGQTDLSWYESGGSNTLLCYARTGLSYKKHAEWMRSLNEIHFDQHRIYVHAGLDPKKGLHEQTSKDLMYRHEIEMSNRGSHGRHVVHGHTPHRNGPVKQKGRTNLDTAAWCTGRLCVAVFADDQPGGPIDMIEVRRP